MLVRARQQELLVRKIKTSAAGIRHRRENPPLSNWSFLLEVARGLELAVLYVVTVAPSHLDNQQAGFVMLVHCSSCATLHLQHL